MIVGPSALTRIAAALSQNALGRDVVITPIRRPSAARMGRKPAHRTDVALDYERIDIDIDTLQRILPSNND
jgi:hypothetical protein